MMETRKVTISVIEEIWWS